MALFHVRMDLRTPLDLDPRVRDEVLAREGAYAQDLQRSGKWISLWRIAGKHSNISIFDVESAEEMNEILWRLPLFDYLTIEVTALTHHPDAISRR